MKSKTTFDGEHTTNLILNECVNNYVNYEFAEWKIYILVHCTLIRLDELKNNLEKRMKKKKNGQTAL